MSASRWPDPGMTKVGTHYVETYRGVKGSGHLFHVRTVSGERIGGGAVSVERGLDAAIGAELDRLDVVRP